MIDRYKGKQLKPVTLRPCKECGGLGHTAFTCPRKHKKPLQAKAPMNKVGRIGKLNAKVSRQHRKANPPNHEGYFICRYCGKWALPGEINGEHTDSKARRPEERMNLDKMVDACPQCNALKGSLSEEEYLTKLKEKKDQDARSTIY